MLHFCTVRFLVKIFSHLIKITSQRRKIDKENLACTKPIGAGRGLTALILSKSASILTYYFLKMP